MRPAWVFLGVAAVAMVGLVLLRPAPEVPEMPASSDQALFAGEKARLAALGKARFAAGVEPRTRHLQPDGSATFTNRLVESSSPYLQQHAHNPVHWFPWGEEAFALAASLDRPILLSIGYATCHWCHVMEEESFEDLEIAAMINEHFVPIKVDRETRPDIDRVYMSAVNQMLKRGGWPATLVLHPDKRPFFAATYLPPRDGDRGRERGFLTILSDIARDWTDERDQIEVFADRLTQAVRRDLDHPGGGDLPGPEMHAKVREWAAQRHDPVQGGTQGRPKFPSTFPNRLMMAYGGDSQQQALFTLEKMAAGGIYDHVGGGFHRYSTDAKWQIPHFEKMLYDNALLARAYGEAFQLTGDLRHARVVDETLTFMVRDLGADGGGFCSALDADSKRPDGHVEEGWYYSWTPTDLEELLGEDAAAFSNTYGVTERGNFEGRNVLFTPEPLHLAARDAQRQARLKLLLTRSQRPPPLRDDKVLTGWNGLAIGALAYNGWLMAREDWLEEARDAATRVLGEGGRLARVDGAGTAFLDDHAFLAEGLVTLFEATGERRWLDDALRITTLAEEHYGSEGAWFRTPSDHETLLTRDKPAYDQAIPSANSVWVGVLMRLAALTGDDVHRQRAERIAMDLPIQRHPAGFPNALLGLLARPIKEVVLVTEPGERSSGLHAALKKLPPHRRVLVHQTAGEPAVVPLAADKIRLGAPTVYVCENGICQRPVTDPAALAALF